MNICIFGSSGVVGHGITKKLSNHNKTCFNSKVFDKHKKRYKQNHLRSNFDAFIHAAGVTDEEAKNNGLDAFNRSNSNLLEILNNLKNKKCKYFIYVSSMRIYDENKNFFHETKSPLKLDNMYKFCHYVAEQNIINFCLSNKKKYLILRPGAVYGFGKDKKINRKKLIPYSFPLEMVKKKKINLKTSGQQFRNFCYNEDIGELINFWLSSKNKKSCITNVKGPETIRVREFANLCINLFKKRFSKHAKVVIKDNKKVLNIQKKIIINQKLKKKFKKNLSQFVINYLQLLLKKNG